MMMEGQRTNGEPRAQATIYRRNGWQAEDCFWPMQCVVIIKSGKRKASYAVKLNV